MISVICLATAFLASLPSLTEEEGFRRVRAHLLIDNPDEAVKEAISLSASYPTSIIAAKSLIESFAQAKKEEEALFAFDHFSLTYPQLIVDRSLLEEIGWGVLRKGFDSTQNGVRLSSLIGAYLTKDIRAVSILKKMMSDSNAVVRSVAAQMSASYGDATLADEIVRLVREEKVWMVRIQAIRSAGIMRIQRLSEHLQKIVESTKSTYEERQFAIEALLNIYEKISLEDWKRLAESNRAGMRILACYVASHFEMKETKEGLLKLSLDQNPDVRIAALNAIGQCYLSFLEEQEIQDFIFERLLDSHPVVSITAAWLSLMLGKEEGKKVFEEKLKESFPETRRLAATALAATGKNGRDLVIFSMKNHEDPYVRTNLALGLIGQQQEVALCADQIYQFLEEEKKMWMWSQDQNPFFKVLSPSRVRYVDQIPNYPEAVDQMTRLNLFSILAIVEDPRALGALKNFLQKKSWGISGVAAATLLQEGDETALEVVKQLIDDPDPNVRLQACLVLATLGKEPSALPILKGFYAGASHEEKLHILEAMGNLGTIQDAPFFLVALKEPFPILRIAAAASLIQCLHH